MNYERRLAEAGFVRGPVRKRYERWDDADGNAVAEVGHDGHLLASPEVRAGIDVVPDVWGSDSARPTWGRSTPFVEPTRQRFAGKVTQ